MSDYKPNIQGPSYILDSNGNAVDTVWDPYTQYALDTDVDYKFNSLSVTASQDVLESMGTPAFLSSLGLAPVATSGDYADLTGTPDSIILDLAPVATSGDYTDLDGRPTLATVATSGLYSDLTGRPTLATVATSGSYLDLTNLPTGSGGTIQGYYFPETYGAVGDGVADDTTAIQAAIDAANTAGGGIVVLSGQYGFSGDIIQKNGVTVIGVGITGPSPSPTGLIALGATARWRFGTLTGPGAHPYPGPLMNLLIDGDSVAGAATELLRCEAVETSIIDMHVMNSLGNGMDLASSQNLNIFNANIGSCPNGAAVVLRAKASGSQPPGHIIFYGGHIGDSKKSIHVTSHDATFFVGPHDNYFIGTIVETGRTAGAAIDAIGVFEDGDTHFDGCVFTIGSQVTAINENASFVVRNDIRPLVSTTLTMRNCSIGGGTGAVKASYGVRVEGGNASNFVYYAGRTAVANVTYMHCQDAGDALVSADGPIVFVTAVTGQFTTINGGAFGGLLRQTQVPTRYSMGSSSGSPLQIRRDTDTVANRWQVSRDGNVMWLDGASGTTRGSIVRNSTDNQMLLNGRWNFQDGMSRQYLAANINTAGTTITCDASTESVVVLNFTATGGTVTTLTINNPVEGSELRIGILGTGTNSITWPASTVISFRTTAPQPISGVLQFVHLYYYGAKWWEVGRSG